MMEILAHKNEIYFGKLCYQNVMSVIVGIAIVVCQDLSFTSADPMLSNVTKNK